MRAGNMALAFAVELAMLAGFAVAGWAATEAWWLRIALAVALPGIAIALWAVWAAPKASKKTRLAPRPLLVFKLAMFAAATLAWWLAGLPFAASVFGTLAAVHLAGVVLFRQY
jgi:hypothetical protein